MAGLQSAAQQLASYGRGKDTLLAHISPDEAHFIDQIQGGRRTNPMTGLPEYSLFGKILKAVVRVGAGVGGFMVGGPAGAAAASAAATKLTGGSWKQSLKAGALSGVGSWGAQGLSGGGWGLTGGSIGANTVSEAAAQGMLPEGVQAAPGLGAALSSPSVAVANPGLSGAAFMGTAKSAPGLAAAVGGLNTPEPQDDDPGPMGPPPGFGGAMNLNVAPMNRVYRPYTGDATKFGETPGGWNFFENVNPAPTYLARGSAVRGPGTETSDSIPAMLSDGEHVVDAATVRAAGHGNIERGHKAIERFKRAARAGAGMRHPHKPPAFGGA